jgi:L-lysine 2,3-aminomutase
LQWAAAERLPPMTVLRINHAHQVNAEVERRVQRLVDAGLKFFNQKALLKDVNDDANRLVNLSERLFDCNTGPH